MMKAPDDRVPKVLPKSNISTGSQTTLARETLNACSKLYELIVQFRNVASTTEEPRAQALFEFSAEMLAGMARAFRTMEEEVSGQ